MNVSSGVLDVTVILRIVLLLDARSYVYCSVQTLQPLGVRCEHVYA